MKTRGVLAGIAFLIVIAALAIGADEKAKKAASPAAMDEKAAMEEYMKYAMPGPEHKKLETFVGTWDTAVKSWMDPTKPAMESKGVSENKMALGGRFLEQTYEGTFMDQPFTGKGYTGYDNYKKQYVGTWMDSMGTAVMNATGTADASGKLTLTGQMDDPVRKKKCDFKETITVVDNDHHTFEMWMEGMDGKMFKAMEIQYTRRK